MSNVTGRVYGARPEKQKKYVIVLAETTTDGLITPIQVVWEDGRRYRIDEVTDRRDARSPVTGGSGLRFTVTIRGTKTYLWLSFEDLRWFVEAKVRRDLDTGC